MHDQSSSSKKRGGLPTVMAPSNSGISCGHCVRLSEGVVRFGIRVVKIGDSKNVRVFVRSFRLIGIERGFEFTVATCADE